MPPYIHGMSSFHFGIIRLNTVFGKQISGRWRILLITLKQSRGVLRRPVSLSLRQPKPWRRFALTPVSPSEAIAKEGSFSALLLRQPADSEGAVPGAGLEPAQALLPTGF